MPAKSRMKKIHAACKLLKQQNQYFSFDPEKVTGTLWILVVILLSGVCGKFCPDILS